MRRYGVTILMLALLASCAPHPEATRYLRSHVEMNVKPDSVSVVTVSALEAKPYVTPARAVRIRHASVTRAAPAPAPTESTSTPSRHRYGGRGSCAHGYVHDLIVRMFASWAHALAVAYRESRCHPDAQNDQSSAAGVFQIVRGTWGTYGCSGSWADRYSAYVNVSMAACIVRRGGWGPWGG